MLCKTLYESVCDITTATNGGGEESLESSSSSSSSSRPAAGLQQLRQARETEREPKPMGNGQWLARARAAE